jgi:formylglycine-generating enzyme required for sulfatase activity
MIKAWLAAMALFSPAPQTTTGTPVDKSEVALVPAGYFWMGSLGKEGSPDERPRHRVYLDSFYMDRYEVSVGKYRMCVDAGKCFAPRTGVGCNWHNPERGENYPVNCVDWTQATSYCSWAGKRLPTEAEWEKASRGGADTKYSFGDNDSALVEHAWFGKNSGMRDYPGRFVAGRYLHLKKYVNTYGGLSHPVGEKKPNQFGLYDMYGNVWEWVADWYDENYYRSAPERNPQGPAVGTQHRFTAPGWQGMRRVIRGGSWYHDPSSSRRWGFRPSMWYDIIGFRCACSALD